MLSTYGVERSTPYGFIVGRLWQHGFSEVRVNDQESFLKHQEYIAENPMKAALTDSPNEFAYCFIYLAKRKAAGAKAR